MPTQSLKDRVYEVIADEKDIKQEIDDYTRLETDLHFDDFDRFELILRLEDVFDILILDTEANEFTTAKDVFDYVESKVNEKNRKEEYGDG